MYYKEKIKIFVSGAAELSPCCPDIKKISENLGKEIAKQGCVLITGATTGAPYYTAKGYNKAGGIMSIGFSPAGSPREHMRKYRLPLDQFDLMIYTGFDYSGRNLIATKSADGVVVVCGRIGTLNEFTTAFESKTPIGILQGTGGTVDMLGEILKKSGRSFSKIVQSRDIKELISKLIRLIERDRKKLTPLNLKHKAKRD